MTDPLFGLPPTFVYFLAGLVCGLLLAALYEYARTRGPGL
jgi:hypothetical protein